MSMNKKSKIFNCHKISEGVAAGEILVSKDDICFYLVEPATGTVIEKGHSLEGKSVAGKILVFPSGKGSSVVQADGLYQLAVKNKAPSAMIVQHPDTVLVASSIIMEVPMVDRVEADFYDTVQDGTLIEVNANKGKVTVMDGCGE